MEDVLNGISFFQDLEEQSRLIAASNRSNQSSGEGQFVVLSSSQSEDSDLGDEGKKKRESEAWDAFAWEALKPCSATECVNHRRGVEGFLY